MNQPELSDGAITLRRYMKKDAEPLYLAVRESLADMKPWLPFAHDDYHIKETKDWLKRTKKGWDEGTMFNFAIVDAADDTMLGGCGLNDIDQENRRANLGYWVRSGRTRRGVATAATLLLAKWGLMKLKLNRIEIVIAADNASSLGVAEKAGAHRESVLRNRLMLHGAAHDAVMFSFVTGDF